MNKSVAISFRLTERFDVFGDRKAFANFLQANYFINNWNEFLGRDAIFLIEN